MSAEEKSSETGTHDDSRDYDEEEEEEDADDMVLERFAFGHSSSNTDASIGSVLCEILPRSLRLFCLQRNPWKRPHTLTTEIRSLLNLNADLESEFYDYVKALESPHYISSLQFNEVIMQRYFMIFAVTRLQMAKFFFEEHGGQSEEESLLLNASIDAWLSYTRSSV